MPSPRHIGLAQASPFTCTLASLLAGLSLLSADVERALRVEGSIAPDGSSVSLQWWQNEPNGPDPVTISRRVLGSEGADTWQALATLPGTTSSYTDTTTGAGIAYEYQVYRAYREVPGNPVDEAGGYWTTGIAIPAVESRGIALLVVDETVAPPLSGELSRLEMDLAGDGWQVVRRDNPRHDDHASARPQALRSWIQSEHAKNPGTRHALLLVGHLPYVMSGRDDPDGHDSVPHPTDLFHADTDGPWSDTVNRGTNNLPGDGILDQSHVPSTTPGAQYDTLDANNRIEMWVGRIDLAGMTAFEQDEVSLLRSYLNKHHAYRNNRFDHPVAAYWASLAFDESPVERYATANICGPVNTTQGDHLTIGQQSPALWGVDFSDWNGENYPDYSIKSIFSINFGSHKQMWQADNNPMRAMLAQPWYVLTCGWGVRPNWHIHHMALGLPIGYSHFRMVNNGYNSSNILDYTEQDDFGNSYRHAVWINLMGDPTLRAFPMTPPANLTATDNGGSIGLDWSAPAGGAVDGYKVYRSNNRLGPYLPLQGGTLVTGTTLTDNSPAPRAWYMVRAQRLEPVAAGSFHNLSQGTFARAGNLPPVPTAQTVTTRSGRPVEITLAASDGDTDPLVLSKASEGSHGTVEGSGSVVSYTPEEGFWDADDSFNFSAFDGTTAAAAAVTVTVLPPSIPPAVTSAPEVVRVMEGNNTTLTVEFSGDLPISFQWHKDGAPLSDGPDFSGTNTETLTIIAAGPPDAGDYHIELTNPVASSSNASSPTRLNVDQENLTDSLLLHYRFDEGGGTTVTDDSPSGRDHTTVVGGANWVAGGRFGGAYGPADAATPLPDFQPANATDINFDPRGNSYTISVWVKTTNTGGYQTIFSKESENPTNRQFKLWALDPVTRLQFYSGDAEGKLDTAATGTPVNDGNWHLLTLVNSNDSGTWKSRLYYDGGNHVEIDSGDNGISPGSFHIGTDKPWQGQLDDLRVYRRALNAAEVAQLHAGTLPTALTYADWSATVNWQGADSSPAADANHNGISNKMEFLLARDPVGPGLPLFSHHELVNQGGDDYFLLEFRRRSSTPRAVFMISPDLLDWNTLWPDGSTFIEDIIDPNPLDDGSAEDVRLKTRIDATGPHSFIRLQEYR